MRTIAPFRGALLSRSFLETLARDAGGGRISAEDARRFAAAWRSAKTAGRRASARALADVFARPVARLLGFELRGPDPRPGDTIVSVLAIDGQAAAMLCVTGDPFDRARQAVTIATVRAGLRWAIVFDGAMLALIDCARPHARRWLAADVAGCAVDVAALGILWDVFGAGALRRDDSNRTRLELMIASSEAALRDVRTALQNGVERASLTLAGALVKRRRRRRECDVERFFEEALTVVYRVLFLQFAEARGLVPVWHPTYRNAYTIEALREQLECRVEPRGVWEALQAMARLAHDGARAGELIVVPFNGRLFSPAHAPAVARSQIADGDAAAALAALTLLQSRNGRPERIPFMDLGVEQLGAIYERVLDFTPAYDRASGVATLRRGSTRKSTGSFYTPRPLTEFIVRRTLAPLVEGRGPEDILALRVLDPAMGSGAFLVAACRFLGRAYESALLHAGVPGAEDFSPADRAGFRRLVAQHCLFGVDLNPMAVQLGRLSLWLCALAANKPLSFLDHRLRAGNSLVGATLRDVGARAPGGRRQAAAPSLFEEDALESVGRAIDLRRTLDAIPDDSVDEVHRKEALLARLESREGPLAAWRAVCDAWCAAWFWPDDDPPRAAEFAAMCGAARGDTSFSHPAVEDRLRAARDIAARQRFFHWPLEFPDVLSAPSRGFDAVIGNPPWEMVRGEAGAQQLVRFTRDSGVYRLQSKGHSNAYQLFAERALQLVRPGGRIGLILPWGLASDEGSAPLRVRLLDTCVADDLVVLDNRSGIFPIHRALTFVTLCATAGGRTESLRIRPAIRDISELDRLNSQAAAPQPAPIELSRALLSRIGGRGLAVPHVGGARDVRILEFLFASAPAASSEEGWAIRFARELNATDDRALMSEGGDGYPVIGGRHLRPFQVAAHESSLRIRAEAARRELGEAALRHRLAYRDVSGAANRTTLIAAVVPPGVVTTHTLFCLKNRLPLADQHFLCALFNSFVANYIVRTRVATHVTTAIVHALPLPRPRRESAAFARISDAARRLAAVPEEADTSAVLQAEVAALYGLDEEMLAAILETFPLVPATERDAVLRAFGRGRGV